MKSVIHFFILYQLPIYYVLSVMIDQLPMPSPTGSPFYKWFFGVSQAFSANLIRAKLGVNGGSNGKTTTVTPISGSTSSS